jgi:hypothetical protein
MLRLAAGESTKLGEVDLGLCFEALPGEGEVLHLGIGETALATLGWRGGLVGVDDLTQLLLGDTEHLTSRVFGLAAGEIAEFGKVDL